MIRSFTAVTDVRLIKVLAIRLHQMTYGKSQLDSEDDYCPHWSSKRQTLSTTVLFRTIIIMQPTYEMTPGFKPFTFSSNYSYDKEVITVSIIHMENGEYVPLHR